MKADNRIVDVGAFQAVMLKVRSCLATWLQERLLGVSAAYWKELVLPKLSFHQRAMVESNRLGGLQDLDFSGLLRVFDKNWYEIDYRAQLKPQLRAYLKELMIVRNRYAHLNGLPDADEFLRDVDTLYRFAQGIAAVPELLAEIKNVAGAEKTVVGSDSRPCVAESPMIAREASPVFRQGAIVRLKADGSKGVVLGVAGVEISVFMNGEQVPFYADQLERDVPQEVRK